MQLMCTVYSLLLLLLLLKDKTRAVLFEVDPGGTDVGPEHPGSGHLIKSSTVGSHWEGGGQTKYYYYYY